MIEQIVLSFFRFSCFQCLFLSDPTEEEQHCGSITLANPFSISDSGVGGVQDGAVAADITDCGVRGVKHSPVVTHISDGGVGGVLDCPVVADIADSGMR